MACTDRQHKHEGDQRLPNIILIMTDDQGYGDLACHGNPVVKTPHLDRLYKESIRLTNYHVGTTCAPTRAGLLTGRNCNRNGVWHTIGGASLLHEREYTLANLFSDHGYETGIFGKWHLGDAYPFRPQDRGFTESVIHGGGGVGQTPDYWDNDYFDDTYFQNGIPQEYKGYCTDVFFNQGLQFIKAHRDQPFFAYISTNAPHTPLNVPEVYREMYDGVGGLTAVQKKFYGMITNIDDNVGRLRLELERLDLEDNTILIFTTDNGTALWDKNAYNAGMRGKKTSEYDGGHRVPFFIRWPDGGLDRGTDIKDLAAHVDVLPTLAGLANLGWRSTLKLDGMDLSQLIKGEERARRRMLVTDTQRVPWPQKGKQSCVMTTDYRLVNGSELYHIWEDPGQTNDISLDQPDLVIEMNDFYNAWWADAAKTFGFSLFKVGAQQQNPTTITVHDGHIDGAVPWHQGYIREGARPGVGPIHIEVVADGNYTIELSRYPLESGLPIGGATEDGYAPKVNQDGRPNGQSIDFDTAEIIANGEIYVASVNPELQYVRFEDIALKKGMDKLSASFIKSDGEKYGAYYIYISRGT